MTMTSLALFGVCIAALALQSVSGDEGTDAAIRKCRMGTITVHARPGAAVKVTQLSHEFWFGTAISTEAFSERTDPKVREQYLRIVKDNFNSAVHENALKWYSTERRQGQVSYDDADRILQWCEANGIRMRGHCIFWDVDQVRAGLGEGPRRRDAAPRRRASGEGGHRPLRRPHIGV